MKRFPGRVLAPLIATTVVLATPLLAPSPASAGVTDAVWMHCRTEPLTWGLYIAPGTGLKASAERANATRALAQVTKASGGAYTFQYVPRIQPSIHWTGSNPPQQLELLKPGYYSTPSVDFMFLVLPKGSPTPSNGELTYPFRNDTQVGGSDSAVWRVGPQDTQRGRQYGHAYLDAKALSKYGSRVRQSAYVWAAAAMTGVPNPKQGYSLAPRDKASIAAMAQTACRLLTAWPLAAPIGDEQAQPGVEPSSGHVEYANWIYDDGTWTLRNPAAHADMQDFIEPAPWNPDELVKWTTYHGYWYTIAPD